MKKFIISRSAALTPPQCTLANRRRSGLKPALLNVLAFVGLFAVLSRNTATAQVFDTYSSNMLNSPIVCQLATTNLAVGLYNTNRIWQGKNLGIAMAFSGGAASNNGTIGFQFAVLTHGINGQMTTTHPFTLTSTVTGTTAVVDWGVIPSYTVGPADAIALIGITNATVNVNATYPGGSVTVSNLWLETDTRP